VFYSPLGAILAIMGTSLYVLAMATVNLPDGQHTLAFALVPPAMLILYAIALIGHELAYRRRLRAWMRRERVINALNGYSPLVYRRPGRR
jgi:hypothetical protein